MTDQKSIESFISHVKKTTATIVNQPTRQDTLKEVAAKLKTAEAVGGEIDKVWKEVFAQRAAIWREITESRALINNLETEFSSQFDETETKQAFEQAQAGIDVLEANIEVQKANLNQFRTELDQKKDLVTEIEKKFTAEQEKWVPRIKEVKDAREKIGKLKKDAGVALDAGEQVKTYVLIRDLREVVDDLDTKSDPYQEDVEGLENLLTILLQDLETKLQGYVSKAAEIDAKAEVLKIDEADLQKRYKERLETIQAVLNTIEEPVDPSLDDEQEIGELLQ